MPLAPGSSHEAFVQNLKTELAAGKPKEQALAIAYSRQRGDSASQIDQPAYPMAADSSSKITDAAAMADALMAKCDVYTGIPSGSQTRSQWLVRQLDEIQVLKKKQKTGDFGEADKARLEELEHRVRGVGR